MNKTLVILCTVLGILFLALAFFYWFTPATALPHFFPGYEAGVRAIHVKHGIASLILGLVFLIVAWFGSGNKKND